MSEDDATFLKLEAQRLNDAYDALLSDIDSELDDDTIKRLVLAAPEVLEFVQQVANTWLNDCQFIPCDTEAAYEVGSKLSRLAAQATQLMAKIEGGEG